MAILRLGFLSERRGYNAPPSSINLLDIQERIYVGIDGGGWGKSLGVGMGFVVDVDQVFDGGVGVALGAG